MSGTPRRINTDRSLGTPSAGGGAEGGVPPKAPPPPPSGPAPQEDDGQNMRWNSPKKRKTVVCMPAYNGLSLFAR